MRVLLPAEARKKKNSLLGDSSSSESDADEPEDEHENLALAEEASELPASKASKGTGVDPAQSSLKKRPRSPDSKPPAKKKTFEMTGGRSFRSSDSAPSPLSHNQNNNNNNSNNNEADSPLENEPPVFENSLPQISTNNQNIISIRPAAAAKSDHHYHEENADDPATVSASKPAASNSTNAAYTNSPTYLAFAKQLKQKRGLEIVPQEGDGNCLFRAVSLQVYGDAEQHQEVRERCLDFMERDPEHFAPFVVGEATLQPQEKQPQLENHSNSATATSTTKDAFAAYIARKRIVGVHGNNPEIQACSELYNRPVQVFTPERGCTPLNIFQTAYKTTDVPIRLSYHDGNHYNAVVDPLVPTAGLGLGLPGLQPGLADKLQVAAAVAESDRQADDDELQRALQASRQDEWNRAIRESTNLNTNNNNNHHQMMMYNRKMLAMTGDIDDGKDDLDSANFELEQKVLANSLESFRRQEHGRKQRAAPTTGGGAGYRRGGGGQLHSFHHRQQQDHESSPPPNAASLPIYATDPSTAVAARASTAAASTSSSSFPPVASMPPAVASAAAAAPASASLPTSTTSAAAPVLGSADEYPQTVQELVMNGFELRKVVHAYELIGDSFDDLLAFLMANNDT